MLIPMMLIPRVPYVFLKCARPFKALLSGRRPSSLVKALINVSKVTECLLKTSMQRTQTPPTWRTTKVLQGAVLARLWNDNIIDVKRKKTLSAFKWVSEVSRFSCWSVSCLCISWACSHLLGMISVNWNLSCALFEFCKGLHVTQFGSVWWAFQH